MSKARELAELGAAYDSGALSNRNFIINGEFAIIYFLEIILRPLFKDLIIKKKRNLENI